MSIRIVTDSTSDLPPGLAAEHGVTVVAQNVLFGDEELRDGVDIDADRFFERLGSEATLPTTSQASPGAFLEAYRRLRDEGATGILSLHVSGKLSGTLDSARQAAREIEDVPIELVDSRLATLALGIGVVTAAKAAAAGASLEEARDAAADQFARTQVFFLVDTLEYLRRGGRIGRAQELVGGLLRVKPLLSLQDGEVVPVGRVRTKAKAVEALIARAAALLPAEQIGAMHAAAPGDLEAVTGRLRALDPAAEIVSGQIGPAIGVHTGPGMLGLAIVTPSPAAAA